MSEDRSEDRVGQMLGPYLLDQPIGSGGMASVYRGVHRYMHVARAVKVMSPSLATQDRFVRLFHREAQLAAALKHPNIVQIYDVGIDGVTHYLVMELLEGRSLREVIKQDRPLSMDRVLLLINQLASALDHAHASGIAHRDVKPANVFVSPDDHLTLVDLGIARAADHTRLTITQGAGTPEYMAPEMFDEELSEPSTDDHAQAVGADLYALGLIAYEMVAGELPFRARSRQAVIFAHVHRPPAPLRDKRADVLPTVEATILRQLSKRPAERFSTAGAFAAALTTAAAIRGPNGHTDLSSASNSTRRPESLSGSDGESQIAATPREEVAVDRDEAPTTKAKLPTLSDIPPPMPPIAAAPSPTSQNSRRVPTRGQLAALVGMIAILATMIPIGLNLRSGPATLEPAGTRSPSQEAAAAVPVEVSPAADAIQGATVATRTPVPAAATSTLALPTPTLAVATPTISPMAQLQSGQAAAFAGDFDRALSILLELKREHPDTPGLDSALFRTHIDFATALRDRGALEQSIAQSSHALRLRPDDSAAATIHQDTELLLNWSIMESTWSNDEERALSALESIWAVKPDYRETRQKLYALLIAKADRLIDRGDRDGALPILMQALSVLPEAAEARTRLVTYTPTPAPTRPPAPVAVPPQATRAPAPQPTPRPAPQPTATKVPFLSAP